MTQGGSSRGIIEQWPKYSLSKEHGHAILGASLGASVFVAGLVLDSGVSMLSSTGSFEGQIDPNVAYAALLLVVVGLCVLFISATVIFASRTGEASRNITSTFWTISSVLSTGQYLRIFILSSVVYALFYGLASGIVVFQPLVNFSKIYHMATPSISIATCCGAIGEYPVATVYLTDNLGLVLIPLNLLFLFSISWLVGLNTALLAFNLRSRIQKFAHGWMGGIGAFVGLFTTCPTCAGLAILSVIPGIGGVGGLSTLLLLDPARTVFVAASYPTLIIGSIMTAKVSSRIIGSRCGIGRQ